MVMNLQHVEKGKILTAAGAIALVTAVPFIINHRVEMGKRKRTERVNRRLADMNIRLMGLACEGMGILGASGDRYLPIDSEQVRAYRRSGAVKEAEKALFVTLAHNASYLDDDACSLTGIYELVCGDYKITKETPYNVQKANAVATVETAKMCAMKESAGLLGDYTDDVLCRGAILLENDIYWAAERSGIR